MTGDVQYVVQARSPSGRWLAPVLAGDTLSGHMIIDSARLSASRPGLGLLEIRIELFNQHGKKVLSHENTGMMLTREAALQIAEPGRLSAV